MSAFCKTKNTKKLVCIEYPGIVENVGNMLQTMNGMPSIEKTYNSGSDRLEMRFRAEDNYSHPTFADRVSTNNLYVKFIRRKRSDKTYEYEAEVIGIVDTSYQFRSLADFQYLPMIKTGDNSNQYKYESITDKLVPQEPFNVENCDYSERKFDPNSPLFVMPTIFSRFDSPIDYFFRNDTQHRDEIMKKELERQEKLSIIGRTRKSRSIVACLLNWSDTTPLEPSVDQKKSLNKESQENKIIAKLSELFDSRPIWSRNALVGKLNCERVDIKHILPKLSYYFVNGPFRCMWIRFGYDPRTDSKSKIYQTLDFRVKQVYAKSMSSERIKAKRSIYQYQLPLKKREHDRLKPKVSTILSESFNPSTSKERIDELNNEIEMRAEKLLASYVFKPGLMPAYRQLFYQLCDIDVEEIQDLIHSNDGNESQVCDERDGWCARGTIDRIRSIMSGIIDDMLADKANSTEEIDDQIEADIDDDDNEDNDDITQNDEFLDYFV